MARYSDYEEDPWDIYDDEEEEEYEYEYSFAWKIISYTEHDTCVVNTEELRDKIIARMHSWYEEPDYEVRLCYLRNDCIMYQDLWADSNLDDEPQVNIFE